MIKRLGKAGKPDLFYEDHGILTLFITIYFGGSAQGFGGYALDAHAPDNKETDNREGKASGLDFIVRLLKLFQVERLEEIEGRTVFAIYENNSHDTIIGLELPEFDGGRKFLVSEWREKWQNESAEGKK